MSAIGAPGTADGTGVAGATMTEAMTTQLLAGPMPANLALLGASSKIAKDLVLSMAAAGLTAHTRLQLYGRELAPLRAWLEGAGLAGACSLHSYQEYGQHAHEAVINFVGVGDPVRTARMGATIFGVTQQYDDMVLDELERHPQRRYIFLSSGAAYGNAFQQPAGPDTLAQVPLNALGPHDYYAVAKLHAECKHRALAPLAITDLRVFNYFGRTEDIESRFFITDILRAVRDERLLATSPDYMVRDYLHPRDFLQLVCKVLTAPPGNQALDCYTLAPVDKPQLLAAMRERFGLRYEMAGEAALVQATGAKPHYYSLRRDAAALGYKPEYTSLQGVMAEAEALLHRAD